jgi:hypothetical protein
VLAIELGMAYSVLGIELGRAYSRYCNFVL